MYIIEYLEANISDLENQIAEKFKIKSAKQGESKEGYTVTKPKGQKEEQKGLDCETLDEKTLLKNSFSLLVGSFLRKQGVTPKNVNLTEYKFLLHTYKALFAILCQETGEIGDITSAIGLSE